MYRLALAASLVAASALTASAAEEGPRSCSNRTDVLNHLANNYSEAPVAVGLAENGGVIELLTSGKGNTWTIIITMPDGTSCMLAAGEDWEQVSQSLAAKGSGI
jgi:hypothetical protein